MLIFTRFATTLLTIHIKVKERKGHSEAKLRRAAFVTSYPHRNRHHKSRAGFRRFLQNQNKKHSYKKFINCYHNQYNRSISKPCSRIFYLHKQSATTLTRSVCFVFFFSQVIDNFSFRSNNMYYIVICVFSNIDEMLLIVFGTFFAPWKDYLRSSSQYNYLEKCWKNFEF